MVDRTVRNNVVEGIAGYMRAEIDNFTLDDILFIDEGGDRSVFTIATALWTTYDDCKRHSVIATTDSWKAMRRCIAYLQTDLELPKRKRQDSRNPRLWPFQTARELFAARPNLKPLKLPSFDSALHDRKIRTRAETRMIYLVWIAIFCALLIGTTSILHSLVS